MNRLFSIFFSLFLLSAVTTHAQEAIFSRPAPKEVPPLLPASMFLGTWEWRSNADVFRITLTYDRAYVLPNGISTHVLLGSHSYTRNGVLIEESYTLSPADPEARTLFGLVSGDWFIPMAFHDLTKNKYGNVHLSISSASPNQLQFILKERNSFKTFRPVPTGFTIPTTMTLTRVP